MNFTGLVTSRVGQFRWHMGIWFLASVLCCTGAWAQTTAKVDGGKSAIDTTALKDSLVQISDDGIVGVGFIGELDGKQYIITTANVVSGHGKLVFTTLSGKPLSPRKIELSATRDLARFQVAGEHALKVNSGMKEDDVVAVLEYNRSNARIEVHDGAITKVGPDMIDLTTQFEDVCCGSPMINKKLEVGGVADYITYYKASDKSWFGTARQFVYKLDDAQWYSPDWKQYNATYGQYLRDADEFRKELYGVAVPWIDHPKERIVLEGKVGRDLYAFVKEHNDMISDLSGFVYNPDDANKTSQKDFLDCCDTMIKICTNKAKQLELLSAKEGITPYLQIQFKWRMLELQSFVAFVEARGRWMEDMQWR